jgi:hypothetical protein
MFVETRRGHVWQMALGRDLISSARVGSVPNHPRISSTGLGLLSKESVNEEYMGSENVSKLRYPV